MFMSFCSFSCNFTCTFNTFFNIFNLIIKCKCVTCICICSYNLSTIFNILSVYIIYFFTVLNIEILRWFFCIIQWCKISSHCTISNQNITLQIFNNFFFSICRHTNSPISFISFIIPIFWNTSNHKKVPRYYKLLKAVIPLEITAFKLKMIIFSLQLMSKEEHKCK